MKLRKIALMHHIFGKVSGFHICKECSNFISFRYCDKIYKKCLVYGNTSSQASDWANKYEACGMFNKEYNGKPIIRCKVEKIEENPFEGENTFEDLEKAGGRFE